MTQEYPRLVIRQHCHPHGSIVCKTKRWRLWWSSILASGTRVRGFKPDRIRWIFRASEKSSASLPSEGERKNLPHVPALRHAKEPSTSVNYGCASKIPCIVPSFASRGLSCLCGAWRLWRWVRGNHWGQGFNRPTGCSAEMAQHATSLSTICYFDQQMHNVLNVISIS